MRMVARFRQDFCDNSFGHFSGALIRFLNNAHMCSRSDIRSIPSVHSFLLRLPGILGFRGCEILSQSGLNPRSFCLLGLMIRQAPLSTPASAQKPLCFSSKFHSGLSNAYLARARKTLHPDDHAVISQQSHPLEAEEIYAVRMRGTTVSREKAMANQYLSPLPGLNLMQTPTGGFAPGYFPAAPSGALPEQFRDRNQLSFCRETPNPAPEGRTGNSPGRSPGFGSASNRALQRATESDGKSKSFAPAGAQSYANSYRGLRPRVFSGRPCRGASRTVSRQKLA